MTASPVELIVEAPDWLDALPDLAEVADTAARAALAVPGIDPATVTIALLACDDTRIAALNGAFRDTSEPTNVLSWPAFALAPHAPGTAPPAPPSGSAERPLPLGDVAIALQTCRAEALGLDRSLKNHCAHLILHGCLHLFGYDHQTSEDAQFMEGIEREALAALAIPDPYV